MFPLGRLESRAPHRQNPRYPKPAGVPCRPVPVVFDQASDNGDSCRLAGLVAPNLVHSLALSPGTDPPTKGDCSPAMERPHTFGSSVAGRRQTTVAAILSAASPHRHLLAIDQKVRIQNLRACPHRAQPDAVEPGGGRVAVTEGAPQVVRNERLSKHSTRSGICFHANNTHRGGILSPTVEATSTQTFQSRVSFLTFRSSSRNF